MRNFYLLFCFLFISKFSFAQEPFITTWEVLGSTSSGWSIEIPTTGTGYNYTVDFGDGTVQTNVIGNITHTYSGQGTYTVSITGDFPRIYFPNITPFYGYKIKSVDQWGDIQWTSMESAFRNCEDLVINAVDIPDLGQVNNMSYMFYDIDSINQSINNWDVSNVTNMSYMFYYIDSINSSLGNWDVSSVTNMSYMFNSAEISEDQLLNLDDWDVSSVLDMSYMFSLGSNSFNQPLNSWDVSNVTTMEGMFSSNSQFNQPLNNWNVSNVINMSKMFYNNPLFNQPLNNWDVSSVTSMEEMFYNTNFNQPLNNWNVSNVTNMKSMFERCDYNYPLNNWDVSSVTNMSKMFYSEQSFDQALENWDVSNVIDMSSMFFRAYSFNQNLNSWDVSNVVNMRNMFQDAIAYNNIMNNWDVSNVEFMSNMFNGATSFNQPLDLWNVSNVWNFNNMFYNANSFNQDLSSWMFYTSNGYINLEGFLDNSGMDVSNYDKLLLSLANSGITDESIGVTGLEYCNIDDRNYLLSIGWTFYFDSQSSECSTVIGNVYYDFDNDGCTNTDIELSNYLINSENTNNSYSTMVLNGAFELFVYSANYTLSLLNVPNYFTISPEVATINFTTSSTEQVDFCLTANQIVNDLNITLLPLDDARPGFEANYKLVIENIGTETINNINASLTFDEEKQSFVSSIPSISNSSVNNLDFSIISLNPFQKQEIDIVMQTFAPPIVNGDDVLSFAATVFPDTSDYTPNDNTYVLDQIVVNAYDPNEKRVLQGDFITTDETDEYLDYIIRFQNTGTANATFVKIEDDLDIDLDWNTLKITSASHAYQVTITNGNEVEFLFDNINLPYETIDESGSSGYIAYKIKPKSTAEVGDIISGNASIYFDYNLPIITNEVSTLIVNPLSVNDFNNKDMLTVYPNPSNKGFYIRVKDGVIIESIQIYNLQGSKLLDFPKNSEYINTKSLMSGVYFLGINTDRGNVTKKIIIN